MALNCLRSFAVVLLMFWVAKGQPTTLEAAQAWSECRSIHRFWEPLQRIQDTVDDLEASGCGSGEQSPAGGARYFPEDCRDVYARGWRESGVYNIYQFQTGQPNPVPVYCDMDTDGGGWLVFQRRQDGSINFYRDWNSYRKGFGELSGEFWLGNDLLHSLTDAKPQELRVDLRDGTGRNAYAKYGTFNIGSQASAYRLDISNFTGTAGDSLNRHNGRAFITLDRLGDQATCASVRSAWWFNSCFDSHLNGQYYWPNGHEITWNSFSNDLEYTAMKMRPIDADLN